MEKQDEIINSEIDGKKSLDEIFSAIRQKFNFEKVQKAMIANEMYWFLGKDCNDQDNYGIPSLGTLQNHAYDLIYKAYSDGLQHSSGGFIAGWDSDEFFLVFNLEEYTV